MSIQNILSSELSNEPITSIPKPPEFSDLVKVPGNLPITTDIQSGSILKVLSENGFSEKIKEGSLKGHTYTILHAAPSSDFTLVETWIESSKDELGNTVTQPKKTYQFFKIISEEVAQPSNWIVENLAHQEDVTSTPNPIEVQIPEIVITPEIVNESQPEPILESVTVADEVISQTVPAKMSSYDLLRAKFAQNQKSVEKELLIPVQQEINKQESPVAELSVDQKKELFIKNLFEMNLSEWDRLKEMPIHAFMYPTQYAWGIDAEGNQIFHDLQDFPQQSAKLQLKIGNSVAGLEEQGMVFESMNVDQVITHLFEKGIL